MSDEKYKNYLKDFIAIILEKAEAVRKGESESSAMFVYFDIISIAKDQADTFGISFKDLGLNDLNEWEYLKYNPQKKSGTDPQD